MKMNKMHGLTNQIRGVFTVERRRPSGTSTIRKNNMVVDSGLAAILHPAMEVNAEGNLQPSVVEHARILKVSNDRTPVTAETTDIGTVVASKSESLLSRPERYNFVVNQGVAEDADGKYIFSRNEWVFDPGEIPTEISKIGVYSIKYNELDAPEEFGLYAATMLTDSEGAVTGLTPFEDESFAITYESRWYLPINDVVIPQVDLKAAGLVDITVRPVGIPTDNEYADALLAASSAQFSYNVLTDYMPDYPAAIVFSSSELHPAGTPYENFELFLDPDRGNYSVIETTDLVEKTVTISVRLGRNQVWPSEARSAILYTSRGIYYLGFSNGIEKAAGSRRTISLNLTFKVGRKV